MRKTLAHPYVLLNIATLIWASNTVAGRLAVGHVSPMALTWLRWTVSALVLLPFAWRFVRADWPVVRRRLPFFALLGFAGFTAFNVLFYLALNYTSAIQAGIVQSAMPLFVFAGMFAVFRTRVTALQVLGFATTLVGVVVTVAQGDPAALLHLDVNRGDAMLVVAVILYSVFTIALARKPPVHWLTLMFVAAVFAALLAALAAAIEGAMGQLVMPDARGWWLVLFTGVVVSIASQSLYIKGVELIGGNRANLFINLVPIYGAILAVAILGEPIHPYHIVSLLLVLGGIALAERGRPKPTAA
ncbi:DMT family transporter [Aureimonas sp. ME7]|uniref:DMT family transporter n=1 Tax=Aureimonas sp. ME7 TaxID=2744252 RepID=UPI0015F6CE27|nr:DMT family transporter [Aureimonas sp. ME7]